MTPKDKAKELKAQFGDNAKYVVLEIRDKLLTYSINDVCNRLLFWNEVLIELKSMKRTTLLGDLLDLY